METELKIIVTILLFAFLIVLGGMVVVCNEKLQTLFNSLLLLNIGLVFHILYIVWN